MFSKKSYFDKFIEIDSKDINELTKDQIYYLMELHKDDGMALNQSSVPCSYQCGKVHRLEKLLTTVELKIFNEYYNKKIGLK